MANVLLVLILFFIAIVHADKDYGYFDYKMINVESCQGPKRKECCYNTLKLNNSLVLFNMDCKENVSPTKGKIVAFKSRQKVRLQMDKPCKHIFIKPIIMNVFNSTDACVINKNDYHFSLDFGEIAQKYYSGMFLYGNWTFRSIFYNDDCNFLCMVLNVSIQPKKEQ